jgi:hypothetical protein
MRHKRGGCHAGFIAGFWIVMQPPLNGVGWMAVFLSGTALLSIILGYTAYRAVG